MARRSVTLLTAASLVLTAGAALAGVLAPQAGLSQAESAETIRIEMARFFFEGPEGRSSSTSDPQVVATLENNRAHRLVFANVGRIEHQVVSPLLTDQSRDDGTLGQDQVRTVAPGETLELTLTPQLLTVEDGEPLTFHLSCHVGHGSDRDHFRQGMHALLKVAPADAAESEEEDDGGPY